MRRISASGEVFRYQRSDAASISEGRIGINCARGGESAVGGYPQPRVPIVDDTGPSIRLFFAYGDSVGGERASTTRRRLAGLICCACKTSLAPDPARPYGERYCSRCAPQPPQPSQRSPARHRVYMAFALRQSWHCQFTEEGYRVPLPCKLTFSSAEKVREVAERGGALSNLESRQMLDYGIQAGRGGVMLKLTTDQLARLKSGR